MIAQSTSIDCGNNITIDNFSKVLIQKNKQADKQTKKQTQTK